MAKEKNKGRRLEIRVRDLFRRYIDPDCERQVMSGGAPGGWDKGDIRFSKVLPYNPVIECKNQERYDYWRWWGQAKEQAGPLETPMLVFTKNLQDDIIAMKLSDFIVIYETLVAGIRERESVETPVHNLKEKSWDNVQAISKAETAIKLIKQAIKLLKGG